MKISTVILAMLLPLTASAQNYQGMSEQDMQNMMQQMQEMQTCMQDIDQSRLKAFEQRAIAVEAEVKSLCANGKRDAAQQEAIALAREITSDPDMQKMRKCTENMQDMMPGMPYISQASEPDTSARHVCDQ
jgi:hypothetical protein